MRRITAMIFAICAILQSSSLSAQGLVLLSPADKVFAGIGESIGNAASGAVSVVAQGAADRQALERARQSFAACYPNCPKSTREHLSELLNKRDVARFMMQTMPSFGDPVMRRSYNEFFDGFKGDIGGRTGQTCIDQFETWVATYEVARDNGRPARSDSEVLANFSARHGQAMAASKPAFQRYLICRDRSEINAARFRN